LYDVTEKVAIVLGTFSYGLIDQVTGSMRNSMVFMAIFFLAGFVLLQTANLKKSIESSRDS
jgi:UMF1 family MFS transporter